MTRPSIGFSFRGLSKKALPWGAFVVAYGVTILLGINLEQVSEGIAVIWPASGVLLASLLLDLTNIISKIQLMGVG